MSGIISALIVDQATRKPMRYIAEYTLPRKGETIVINGTQYWVENIVWHFKDNTIHKREFTFEGIEIFVATAGAKGRKINTDELFETERSKKQ